jgi:phage gp29-like protein
MRTAVWWSTFKTMSVRDWLILANRFGIPFITGEYDESISDDDKEVLRQAARDLGTDGYAIFSQQAKLVIHEIQRHQTGNAAEGIHGALMTICDLQNSKLIEGATLVSEVQGPGSHALGTVHENRYHDILEGDAEKLSESFQAAVGLPFVRFNGLSARPPRLKIHLGLNVSLKERIGIALDLANRLDGFELDEEQIRTMTLLRRPRPGSPGLRGIEVAKLEQTEEDAEDVEDDPAPA